MKISKFYVKQIPQFSLWFFPHASPQVLYSQQSIRTNQFTFLRGINLFSKLFSYEYFAATYSAICNGSKDIKSPTYILVPFIEAHRGL